MNRSFEQPKLTLQFNGYEIHLNTGFYVKLTDQRVMFSHVTQLLPLSPPSPTLSDHPLN